MPRFVPCLAAWLALSACSRPSPAPDPQIVQVEEVSPRVVVHTARPTARPPERNPELTELAAIVRQAFADRDGATLARWASAEGVRFTPYAWISPEGDVELQSAELRGAFEDPQVRTWGSLDGSGDPIALTFAAYVDRFVTPKLFVPRHDPEITEHSAEAPGGLGGGNTRTNLLEIYPDARWIELYVPGLDPKYGGMDWARLALVFVSENGTQKLRAVIHDQWTI